MTANEYSDWDRRQGTELSKVLLQQRPKFFQVDPRFLLTHSRASISRLFLLRAR